MLRPDLKTGKDYMLLPDEVYTYLHSVYGGQDIRRYSIERSTSPSDQSTVEQSVGGESDASSLGCQVEIFLARVRLIVVP